MSSLPTVSTTVWSGVGILAEDEHHAHGQGTHRLFEIRRRAGFPPLRHRLFPAPGNGPPCWARDVKHLELDRRELAYGFAERGLLRRRQIPIRVSQLLRPPC